MHLRIAVESRDADRLVAGRDRQHPRDTHGDRIAGLLPAGQVVDEQLIVVGSLKRMRPFRGSADHQQLFASGEEGHQQSAELGEVAQFAGAEIEEEAPFRAAGCQSVAIAGKRHVVRLLKWDRPGKRDVLGIDKAHRIAANTGVQAAVRSEAALGGPAELGHDAERFHTAERTLR